MNPILALYIAVSVLHTDTHVRTHTQTHTPTIYFHYVFK